MSNPLSPTPKLSLPLPDTLGGLTKKKLEVQNIHVSGGENEVYISRDDLLVYFLKLENHFLRNDELASEAIPNIAALLKSLTWGKKDGT